MTPGRAEGSAERSQGSSTLHTVEEALVKCEHIWGPPPKYLIFMQIFGNPEKSEIRTTTPKQAG